MALSKGGIRYLPPSVYRLPTLMMTFNTNGNIKEKLAFDETKGTQIDMRLMPGLAVTGLLSKKPIVMPLSLEDSKGNTHCNAIIIKNGIIERFEPRGRNIKSSKQSKIVQSFYDPDVLDSTMASLVKSWYSDRRLALEGRMLKKKIPKQYFRYSKPKQSGIYSNDTQNYKNATKCTSLTFNYVRIRVKTSDRNDAYTKWLKYEKK